MAYLIEPQIFNSFKGIREYNGVNSGGQISAIDMQNVELVQTELGSETGIKSMDGNVVIHELPAGYEAIGMYKSVQDNRTYELIYGETDTKGTLFYLDLTNKLVALVDDMSKTGHSNGLTMSSTAYDVFVFTNGEEVKTVCFNADDTYGEMIKTIEATDYQGRALKWLSMTNWNGFLVVASQYGVHSSHQNDIYTWNDNPTDIADSWYIDFSKKVTAVVSFTNGLYIFTDDDLSLLTATPNDTTNSTMRTSAMNGCFDYQSIVKHDTYLFFYDNNQKNIYYLSITDTGQTRPTGPVAQEIQSYFNNVKTFKMFSCIYGTRNEVWCLVNDDILIFDYTQKEWTKRVHQNINSAVMISNTVFTAGKNGKIYVENINADYDGAFYASVYKTTFINIGSNSNMKKQKTPLLIVINDNYTNDFWVELTCNGKEKNPKLVRIGRNDGGVFYNGQDGDLYVPNNQKFGTASYSAENPYAKRVVEISTPQTWYTLGIKIFTKELGQGFHISSMELKNIKGKTKTKGR